MKKVIVCIFLMLNIKLIYSQNRVFSNYSDMYATTNQNIKNIRIPFGNLGSRIIVIYTNGTKARFRKTSIWGIETSKKEIFRFYNRVMFICADTSGIIIYKTWARYPMYYFSQKLDSKVKLFSKKELIKMVGKNEFDKLYERSDLLRKLCQYY